jgi:hypothetical protein
MFAVLRASATPVDYLPILTTGLAATFAVVLFGRWRERGRPAHLGWWSFGVVVYGFGTGLEAAITLWGNHPVLTKAWFVAGALLGGYPLAQGSVHLLLRPRLARALTAATLPVLVVLSLLAMLSPVETARLDPHRPGGAALSWQWLRWFTPLVNGYAALFLIGGAAWSAFVWRRQPGGRSRALGNALIAAGALLPGIGGVIAKTGSVHALYVGEFCGLLLIWAGYASCRRAPVPALS